MFSEYEYEGGAKSKRPISVWNQYVKDHAHEYKGKNLPAGQMMKELAKRARDERVIGNAKPVKKTPCAQKPYNDGRTLCLTNPDCAWREQTYTKKGTTKKGFCTKGTRPTNPRYA